MPRTSSKSKNKSGSRKSSGSTNHEGLTSRLTHSGIVRGLTILVFILTIGTGWVFGVPRLKAHASGHLAAPDITIVFPPLPVWLDQGDQAAEPDTELHQVKARILNEIEQAARQHLSGDPLDRIELVQAHESLLATGWFKQLDRLERTSPSTITVLGEFVSPFTMVQSPSGNHLVDASGNRLPLTYRAKFRTRELPLIRGVRFAPPTMPGGRWEGMDVQAGLKLAMTIQAAEWVSQIAEIDVSEFLTDETLWMTTDRGARILWGRVPGQERGVEVPAAQKLSYLDWFYSNTGRVEGVHRHFDVRFDVPTVR